MVVDLVRSCYSTTAKLFRNRLDIDTEIYWYRCPPGAKFLPFPSFVCSRNWDDYWSELNGLGEVYGARRPWKNGHTPGEVSGLSPCGDAAEFSDGFFYDPSQITVRNQDGISLCCLHRNGKLFVGGLLLGGKVGGSIVFNPLRMGLKLGGNLFVGVPPQSVKGGLLLGKGMTPGLVTSPLKLGLLLGGNVSLPAPGPLYPLGLLLGGNMTITGGSGVTTSDCVNLAPAMWGWKFTAAGYTGAAAALNGSWELKYSGSCLWQTKTVAGARWQLFAFGGPALVLSGIVGAVDSVFDSSSFVLGTAANVLPWDVVSFGDTGHPPAITIIPN